MKLGVKTFLGCIIWGVGMIASPDGAAIVGEKVATVAQAIGGVLAALGIRHAVSKNGTGS